MFETWKSKNPDSWFSCVPGENGFLPIDQPLEKLPDKYNIINELLENMKINNNGYLKHGTLENEINNLPLFDFSFINDAKLLSALHRDYCFLASAYSLEPCHIELEKSNNNSYGQARNVLPPQLSIPLICLSKKLDTYPWLDYAYGYGLNNAVLINKENKCDYKNYKTVRTFNGHESEEGFINVHVAMVAQSGDLLKFQQNCLKSISLNMRDEFNSNLEKHFNCLYSIVDTLQTMWKASNYKDYLSFRTFIMGQIGNSKCYPTEQILFDKGDNYIKRYAFRGETGAQDSIIPSVDSFLQLDYPNNELTRYLFDLRKYRPKDHQEYINFTKESSIELEFKNYCMKDEKSSILLLKNLNCVRMFRKKHWNLTKKYIIQNTKHPVATGGTPITTWLPNQLGATLEYMDQVVNNIDIKKVLKEDEDFFNNIKLELSDHIQTIMDEVSSLQKEFEEQKHSDFLNR